MKILKRYLGNIKPFSNEKGYTLVLVLLIFVVFSIVGTGLLIISSNTMKTMDSERDDQSAYYIAEAGLVEVRANINELAKLAYSETLNYYNNIEDLQVKSEYNFLENFLDNAKGKINNLYFNGINPTSNFISAKIKKEYEKQLNSEGLPVSETTVEFISEESGSEKLTYLIRSNGIIENKTRNVSQKVEITLNVEVEEEEIIIGEDNNTHPYEPKACYALYANGAITAGSGTISGDIYSKSKLVINNSGASMSGNVYSTEDIEIKGSQGIKNVYSPKNVTITGGSIAGSVFAGQKIDITGGTVNGDLKAVDTITAIGGTVNGNVVSKNNVNILAYPSISKDIIALNDIYVKQWFNAAGNYRYGGIIKFDQNVNANTKLKPLSVNEKIAIEQEDIINTNEYGEIINSCTEQMPTLQNVDTVFMNHSTVELAPNIQIFNSDSNSYVDVIKNGNLTISHYKTEGFTLDLSNDMYFKSINVDGYKTLNIDLKGETRSIFVDSLNVAGHINIMNPGILKIYVLDNLNYTGGSFNKNGYVTAASIYYSGTNSISFGSDLFMNTDLHVKNADVTFTAGGRVKGNVFVYGNNKVTVTGGSAVTEQLFLAPNSEFIHNNGIIKGNVVAKNYTMSGGATIDPPEQNGGATNPGSGDGEKTVVKVKKYNQVYDLLYLHSQLEE
nr:polymer-forming cytoskeletal protein [Lysinibacillus timonensis]